MRRLLPLLLCAAPAFAGSSSSLLDVTPDGKRMAVANTDSGTVTVVDLAGRKAECELPAGDHPEGVSWVGNGPVFLATVYGDDRVVFYDADAKKVLHVLAVPDEPYGVVVAKDGKTAYVTHDYPGAVSVIDVASRSLVRTVQVGENVRGLAIGHDGKTLYVTEFLTSHLLAVDAESGKVTDRWNGYEQDSLARHVVLHPKRDKAYLSHTRSRVTNFGARESVFPRLSFCDLWKKPDGEKRRRTFDLDTYNGVYVITNPWEAALSPDGTKLYTIYAGTNDANVSKVIDDDYREAERTALATRVGTHPRAVRTSPDGKEVYIYATLDFRVGVFDPDLKKITAIEVTKPPHTPAWVRGKELFQLAAQPMGSARWIACSSCHPDGLSDGRVWQNPEGPRRTPNLFALAHTHPLHWSADRDESQDFEFTVRGKLMLGRGLYQGKLKSGTGAELEERLSGKSADLDALAVYTNSFPARLSPHAAGPGKLTPEAERGKAVFFSPRTQCATCHTGPYYTDSSLAKPFKMHDVGTGGGPREKFGPAFDTPTLLSVYRTGPYLHDGRAKTLADVLTSANPGDKHGTTSHLSKAEVAELAAFLKSLPYEELPDVPNTVKDKVKLAYPRPTVPVVK